MAGPQGASLRSHRLLGMTIAATVLIAGRSSSSGQSKAPSSAPGSVPQFANPVEGFWLTQKLTKAQIVQAFVAAGGSAAAGTAFFAGIGGGARTFVVIDIHLEDGQFSETERADNGIAYEGYLATYALSSGSTMTMTSTNPRDTCVDRYTYVVSGSTLRLHDVAPCKQRDGIYNETLFGSFPYTKAS
jgi:hypothetical protein